MNKNINAIFAQAEEKFLSGVIVYAQADDGKLFYDNKYTLEVSKEELFNLALKDLVVINYENVFYKVANFSDKTTHVEVNVESETGWLTFKSADK